MDRIIVRKRPKANKAILFLCGAIAVLQILNICFVCTMYTQQKDLAAAEPTVIYRTIYIKEIPHNTETTAETTTEEGSAETAPAYTEMTVTATAYCACEKCCGKTDGITATGTKATAGRTLAVDPSVIPYGTEVIINGNTYVAEDCGGGY